MSMSRVVVLALCAAAASAADDLGLNLSTEHVADVRFLLGPTPKFKGPDGRTDRGVRVGGGVYYSFVGDYANDLSGLLVGVEATSTSAPSAGASSNDMKVQVFSGTVLAGLAYQFPDLRAMHMELTPLASAGYGDVDVTRAGISPDTVYASFHEFGLRFGLFYTMPWGLQFGGDVRWVHGVTSIKAIGERTDVADPGVAVQAAVGWRF